ncbi:PH domain-containing protein [Geodermatophilus nigrescens]|uniref:PH domain-containing protein n=1 Tax=Geodermatophilus nigrescens TaxID=1070870 RepID=UPI0009344ED0
MGPVPTPPAVPVSATPRRLRLICAVAAAVVVAVMVVVAVLLTESSTGVVTFGLVDQVAVVGLGLFVGGGVMLAGASRVDADADGVRVRNVLVKHELGWDRVRAVRFDRHSSWASLELTNDDEVAVLAVQAVDRQRALDAVEGLRALLAAHRAAHPKPATGPLLYEWEARE